MTPHAASRTQIQTDPPPDPQDRIFGGSNQAAFGRKARAKTLEFEISGAWQYSSNWLIYLDKLM
jgi:hypothetical protein